MTITSFIIEVSRWSEAAPRGTDRPKSRCLNALVTTRRNAVTWRSGTLVVAVQQNTTHRNNNTRNGNHKSGHKQHVVRGGDEDNASTILAKLPKCIPPYQPVTPPSPFTSGWAGALAEGGYFNRQLLFLLFCPPQRTVLCCQSVVLKRFRPRTSKLTQVGPRTPTWLKIIVLLQKAYKKTMTQRVIPSVIVLLMDTIWVKVNDHLRPKWCLKSFLGYQQKFANNFCPVHLCESDQGSVLHNGRDCLTALTDI